MIQNMNVAEDSLEKARDYLKENNYGRAFAHYLIVLQILDQEDRSEFEEEFYFTWSLWKNNLFEREKYKDILSCFDLSNTYFPKGVQELNELGILSLKSNKLTTAKFFFEAALSRNPNYLPAEQNLLSTKYGLVERWHFRMLNDYIRNKAYKEAILTDILNGYEHILDIGTGTGIFSIISAENATNIVACDESQTMCEIANKIIKINDINKINLLNVHSSQLVQNNYKNKFDLVITEILDSGIFGEHILETLIDAWDNLLVPKGKIIPSRVEVYISGISSQVLSSKFRSKANQNILNLNNFCISCNTDPYDSDNLSNIPFNYVTDSQLCLNVNFNDVKQLKTILHTNENNPKVKLKTIMNSQIDAFVIWFKLYLNDSIFISNEPKNVNSCWEQAIINIIHPIVVKQNDITQLKVSCVNGCLKICDLTFNDNKINTHECFNVNKEQISILNDDLLLKTLENVSNVISSKYNTDIKILDLSQFPIFGLLMFLKGAIFYCQVSNITKKLIHKICNYNHLDFTKIHFISDFNLPNIKFDFIYQNLVDNSGLLNESEILQTKNLNNFLSIFVPKEKYIWAEIGYCEWLDRVTKVDDKNVFGLKIADVINEYKTIEQRDITLDNLNYISYSEPQKVGVVQFDTSNPYETKNQVKLTRSGCANAIFYWFEINFYDNICISTRRTESFANNAAVMLENNKNCVEGDNILLNTKQHEGLLKIFID